MLLNNFLDFYFFGNGKKSASDYYKISKKWAGLNIFYSLISLVIGRFDPELAEGMDPRYFELTLICKGINGTAIGKDGTLGNFQVGYGNQFSKYGYYNNVTLMDFMGMSQGQYIPDCPGNIQPDCVLTYDNMYNLPPIFRIKWYAERLTLIQSSIAACIANMKGTVIFQCAPEQKKAIKRAWEDANDGSPVIISCGPGEGDMAQEPQVITNPQTGDILKQLQETYDKTMADFLTEFGINANGVINKLSGISDTELKQNDQARQINLYNALKMRQEAMEKINKMFGTNCVYKLAEPLDIPSPEEMMRNQNNKEEDAENDYDV